MQPTPEDYISRSEKEHAGRTARLESDKYTLNSIVPITEAAEWARSRGYQCVTGFDGIILQRKGATVYGEKPPMLIANPGDTLWYDDGRITIG